MEKIQNFGHELLHDRVLKGITIDATRSNIIKVMDNLVDFDERYGRKVSLDLAKGVDALLVEAHEILTEFIADNEAETE